MNTMNCKGLSLNRIGQLVGKRHPLTGELLVPLGRRASGQLIWPQMGGSEDAGAGEGSTGEGSDGESGSKDKEGSGNSSEDKENGEKDKKPEPGSEAARIAALEDEKERQYTRRKEAEARAEKAEAEAKELREKDLPEVDKLKGDVETLTSDNKSLNEALVQSRLEIAFLKDNTYNWHNPGRALQAVDLSHVEIDKDGSVKGLAEALESLAKSDPYLIKEEKTSDDKDKSKKEEKDAPKSGDQKNNSAKDKSTSSDKERARLVEKYPGLRR